VPLTVRRIHPEEYAEVAELTARVYLDEGYGSTDYEPALRMVASRDASAVVLVALLDEELVGAVTVATRLGEWAEHAVPGEAVIRMLAVDPRARRSGAGSALVQACIEQSRADDCRLIRLSTEPGMTVAHRLYERAGFVRTPSYDWSPVPGVDLRGYAMTLVPWCDQCGEEITPEGHEACRRGLDPPRFCGHCRRRMVVQVTPTGWTAKCVEHGVLSS
jgi:ribosomal protein S18 acetylase RimI-like enzyme